MFFVFAALRSLASLAPKIACWRFCRTRVRSPIQRRHTKKAPQGGLFGMAEDRPLRTNCLCKNAKCWVFPLQPQSFRPYWKAKRAECRRQNQAMLAWAHTSTLRPVEPMLPGTAGWPRSHPTQAHDRSDGSGKEQRGRQNSLPAGGGAYCRRAGLSHQTAHRRLPAKATTTRAVGLPATAMPPAAAHVMDSRASERVAMRDEVWRRRN